MVFKKLAMEYAQFDLDNLGELQHELQENCKLANGPMSDLTNNLDSALKDKNGTSRKRRD